MQYKLHHNRKTEQRYCISNYAKHYQWISIMCSIPHIIVQLYISIAQLMCNHAI